VNDIGCNMWFHYLRYTKWFQVHNDMMMSWFQELKQQMCHHRIKPEFPEQFQHRDVFGLQPLKQFVQFH
jgi:hypothetical protein